MLLKVQEDNVVCVVLLVLFLFEIVIYNVYKGTRQNKFITSAEAAKVFSKYAPKLQPSRAQY